MCIRDRIKSYKTRFQKFSALLSDPEIAKYARQNGNHAFSRKRKMPLKDMLLCCLSKKGLTTTFELRNYFKEKGDLSMQLSVQGYLQQRKRLNPEIFPYLNRKYLMDFYRSDEPRLWKGYLLIAIDGSKAEVPNSKDNREAFGNSGNQMCIRDSLCPDLQNTICEYNTSATACGFAKDL